MTQDGYVIAITALLPLTATMVITQKNPYSALVMRGILGAVAALVYLLFGAADVALTEALVGTMLSITLYAIAVRSSMTMRLGVLSENEDSQNQAPEKPSQQAQYKTLLSNLQQSLRGHHLQVEPVSYPSTTALKTALEAKEIHGMCTPIAGKDTYRLSIRVPKLYEIIKAYLPAQDIVLTSRITVFSPPPSVIDSPYPRSSEVQP